MKGYRNRDKSFIVTIFTISGLFLLLMVCVSINGMQDAFWGAIKSILVVM
jgi:hypothetical protein